MNRNNSASDLRSYWRVILSQTAESSGPPPDYPRPDGFAARQKSVPFGIRGPLHQRLKTVSSDSPLLLYATLMTALKVTLYKHTRSRHIVVGSPARLVTEGALQPTHALPIVDMIDGAMRFRALLEQVRHTLLDAYARQQVNPAELLPELAREVTPNRCPLFDVALCLDGLHAPLPESRNDITLRIRQTKEGLECEATYRTALFGEDSMHAFVNRFLATLHSALWSVDKPVGAIDALTSEERRRVLVEWNDTERALPPEGTLHELFSRQALQNPDAIAVRTADGLAALTFRELDERSNQLAHYLRGLGQARGAVVAVCLPRSPETLLALLGVLKTGAAYLPLEPDDPEARNSYMLQDAGVKVLISESLVSARLPESDVSVVLLDKEQLRIAALPAGPPGQVSDPDDLAYVLYTSGTSGRPKGVMVPHRGVVNYLSWCLHTYDLHRDGEVPVHGPLTSDMTVTSIFAPLLAGRAVTMLPEGPGLSRLIEAIERRNIFSFLKLTPTHLVGLSHGVSTDDPEGPARTMVVGGEALRADLVSLWQTHGSGVAIYNEYGPTETVVGSCAYRVPDGLVAAGMVPIGRPIDNTAVYILDADLQPVPPGVAGEICIGGAGVARGYLNLPGLTAERFIPDPFTSSAGARLYRTGDAGRYRSDGNIEFLGRYDSQIKIRGYRVEPGEVEAVLVAHQAVQEAVVVAQDAGSGTQRLAAYFVSGRTAPPLSELRRFLEQRLPEHMIPSSFVVLNHIPRLPNGKIDRRALPSPQAMRPRQESAAAPATSDEERTLAEIWSEVLGVKTVGADDNFFELGGDSILIIQIVARAREAGLRLQLNDIFDHPTLADLARHAHPREPDTPSATGSDAEQQLLPMQLWFFDRQFTEPNHFNQSLLLRLDAGVRLPHVEQALAAVIERHEGLRSRFVQTIDGWRAQRIDNPAPLLVPSLDLSGLDEASAQRVMSREANLEQTRMDIERGETLRAIHFELGDGSGGRLLLAIHHLVVDVVSWVILLGDLGRACAQIAEGVVASLPPATDSSGRWSDALSRQVEAGAFNAELPFWLSVERQGVTPLLRDVGCNGDGLAVIERALDEDLTEGLLRGVPGAYPTQVEEVLISALALALSRTFAVERFLLDVEHHGREPVGVNLDLTRTVGWLATIHPLLLDVSSSDAPLDVLAAVKDRVQATPRRGLGYAALRYLGAEEIRRELAAMPQAEVSFAYLGRIDAGVGARRSLSFRLDDGPRGIERSKRNLTPYAVSLDLIVAGGCLQARWTWAETALLPGTVARLADSYAAALRSIVEECLSDTAVVYRPSDFDLVDLDQETLDRIIARGGGT